MLPAVPGLFYAAKVMYHSTRNLCGGTLRQNIKKSREDVTHFLSSEQQKTTDVFSPTTCQKSYPMQKPLVSYTSRSCANRPFYDYTHALGVKTTWKSV